jgi:ABC-type multidrug transport system ATPase subunit
MKINLQNAGKRYNREWIFRKLDFTFSDSLSYAITGPNGSGKSTLLQVIAGALLPSEGKVLYSGTTEDQSKEISPDLLYKEVSLVAPYIELVEEMTATEQLQFHSSFKGLTETLPFILEEANLTMAAHKQIRYFSSGMKQRLKMVMGFFSTSSVLLLDEPTTNLDAEGISLYKNLTRNQARNRLVIISSNDPQEYDFCQTIIDISRYK